MHRQRRTLAIQAGLLAVFFWGGILRRYQNRTYTISPITLIVIRLEIGICVLYPIA